MGDSKRSPARFESTSVHIDASNLRAGGGVQVAASFIDELADLAQDESMVEKIPWIHRVLVTASDLVLANTSRPALRQLAIREATSSSHSMARWSSRARPFDVTFTIFGPAYGWRDAKRTIVGFADLTSVVKLGLQGSNHTLGSVKSLKPFIRRQASRASFAFADHIVVEASHVADKLEAYWGIPRYRISVVPNALNAAVRTAASEPLAGLETLPGGTILWAYITRAYPHKNISLLGHIGEILESMGVPVKFLLTLTKREWTAQSSLVRKHSINLGPVSVHQLKAIYARSTGAVFPSLLESFSVTPLEAMSLGCGVVASNRDFVRDICGDGAWYADPNNPEEWAGAIASLSLNSRARSQLTARGRAVADAWPTARDRAVDYLQIIDWELGKIMGCQRSPS